MISVFPSIQRPPLQLLPSTRRLNFYIVFHRDVLPENTRDYSKEELNERFTWAAVNEMLPKVLPKEMEGLPVLEEYKLPRYTRTLQANNYYQNSFFFHLYWNHELLTSDYVGFGQYDMEFHKDTFERCISSIYKTSNIVIGFYPAEFWGCPHVFGQADWAKMFLEPYNHYHSTRHTWRSLSKHPLCLYHTFILPRDFFVEMMKFVENNMPNLLAQMKYDARHLAGTMERVFAFCISCALEEGRLQFQSGEGIEHRDEQRWADPFRNVPGRT